MSPVRSEASPGRTAALVGACVVWGSSFLFGKIALAEIGVAHLVLERFALGSAALLPIALARRSLPRRGDLPLFLLAGAVGVPGTFLLQFEGLARTTVTSASLIVGAAAPLVALGAAVLHGDRLGRSGWLAVSVSTAGVALVVGLPGPGRTLLGDALVFLSMVLVAAYILLSARLLDRYDALGVTAWSLAFGTAFLAPIAWGFHGAPPVSGLAPATVGSVLALGLGCTAATYLLWNWGLAGVPASRAGIYVNLEPVVGALLGVWLLGDAFSPGLLVGGAAIVGAAIWISRPDGPPAAPRAVEEPCRQAA